MTVSLALALNARYPLVSVQVNLCPSSAKHSDYPAPQNRAKKEEIFRLLADDPWSLLNRPNLLSQGPLLHPALQSVALTV